MEYKKKFSRRFEGNYFLYWWDITPNFKDRIHRYKGIEFIQRDSGKRCSVSTVELEKYLTPERQTSRGEGNWGVKVLKDKVGELVFEPPSGNSKWLFLSVEWLGDTMCGVNEAVEKIVLHKGNLIKRSKQYKDYIESVLREHDIISTKTSREEVKVLVKVFKMGAVDAMIYDVGSALDFTKKKLSVDDWTSFKKRKKILRKKFLEE